MVPTRVRTCTRSRAAPTIVHLQVHRRYLSQPDHIAAATPVRRNQPQRHNACLLTQNGPLCLRCVRTCLPYNYDIVAKKLKGKPTAWKREPCYEWYSTDKRAHVPQREKHAQREQGSRCTRIRTGARDDSLQSIKADGQEESCVRGDEI